MARKPNNRTSKSNEPNLIMDMLEEDLADDSLSPIAQNIKSTFGSDDVPKSEPREIIPLQPKSKIRAIEKVTKVYRIDDDISTLLDSLTKDSNGRQLRKGTLSVIAQNGIIRELVHNGLIGEEYLKRIRDYD